MFQWVKDKAYKAWEWAKAIAGNSKTVAAAYAAEALGLLDELQILDWSSLLGVEKGGRIMAIMGFVMFGLRLLTKEAVSFKKDA